MSVETTAAAPHIHAPKIELFDTRTMTNTDPKGFRRTVDEYRREEFGLYLAREVVDHHRFRYLESWLLPEHRIRLSRWTWWPGEEADYDFYLDVAEITRSPEDPARWRTRDCYLDILVRTGRGVEVVDSDELIAAVRADLLSADSAERAMTAAHHAVGGIAAHGYDVTAWLASTGVTITWREPTDSADS
ncbi:DUF402 domain-containing protein [Actinoalloteichus caeruleus]|uniref:DUF402 domain-containing protein n=1 Tax=Actinoalloteichus cyanogriseus TaxID=2893586 RepID=UPI003AADE463